MKKILFPLLCLVLGANAQSKIDSIFKISAPKAFEAVEKIKATPANDSLLTLFEKTFEKDFDDSLQFKKILTENPDVFEMSLFAQRKKQTDFLKKYPNLKAISPACITLLENQIKYNYWYYLLAQPVKLSNLKQAQLKLISLPEIMTSGLDIKKVNQAENLQSSSFRKFQNYFVTYFNSKQYNFDKYKDGSKAAIDKFNFADSKFTDENLQYFLTTYLSSTCSSISPSILKILISNLEKEPREEINIQCAEAINKKEEVIATKSNQKVDEWGLMGLDDKPLMLNSMKGKVIYVDFWASWCGPCKREFPYSMQMIDKLTEKQKKKIEFLFISIDDDNETWKNVLSKNKLGGQHGWISGGWAAKLLSKYNVNSIPRYMIINQNGAVVNPNAPRPSEAETFDLLLKLAN